MNTQVAKLMKNKFPSQGNWVEQSTSDKLQSPHKTFIKIEVFQRYDCLFTIVFWSASTSPCKYEHAHRPTYKITQSNYIPWEGPLFNHLLFNL